MTTQERRVVAATPQTRQRIAELQLRVRQLEVRQRFHAVALWILSVALTASGLVRLLSRLDIGI